MATKNDVHRSVNDITNYINESLNVTITKLVQGRTIEMQPEHLIKLLQVIDQTVDTASKRSFPQYEKTFEQFLKVSNKTKK